MHFSTTFLSCLCCAVLPEAVLVVRWVTFLSSTGYWWKWAHLVWLHPERIQRVLREQWCVLGGFQASNWQSPEQPGLSLVLTLLWATGCAGNPWSFSTWWFYDLWLILFSLVSEEHLLAVVTRSCCLRTRFTQLKFMNCVNRKENRCGFFMQMLLFVTHCRWGRAQWSQIYPRRRSWCQANLLLTVVQSRGLTVHMTAAGR